MQKDDFVPGGGKHLDAFVAQARELSPEGDGWRRTISRLFLGIVCEGERSAQKERGRQPRHRCFPKAAADLRDRLLCRVHAP